MSVCAQSVKFCILHFALCILHCELDSSTPFHSARNDLSFCHFDRSGEIPCFIIPHSPLREKFLGSAYASLGMTPLFVISSDAER